MSGSRIFHPAAFAACSFLVVVALALVARSSPNAGAGSDGGMDAMSVDLDITGNAATSLDALDSCIGAAPGDTITFDITATNIPTGFEMVAFSYTVNYDEAALTIETQDHEFLLAANFPSAVLNASQETPDTNSDGSWIATVVDIGGGQGEAGSGVLSRLTISVAGDAPSGVYTLALTGAAHIDNLNEARLPNALNNGEIAVGVSCPSAGSPTPSPIPTPPASPSPTPIIPTTGLAYSPEAYLSLSNNYAIVTGTVTCSEPVQISVSVQVSQWVKGNQVAGSEFNTQQCSGLTEWAIRVEPFGDRFKPGMADVFVLVEAGGYPGLGDSGPIRLKPGTVK